VSIHKWLFCPIPVSGSNFNPRNITYIPAVKIFAFLGLEQNISFLDRHCLISPAYHGRAPSKDDIRYRRMSLPRPPGPAKLVIGLIAKEKKLFQQAAFDLTEKFGMLEMISSWLPFEYTDYYESEMGAPLFRRVLVFKNLIEQETLPEIKTLTNRLEEKYSKNGNRQINIDPGYLLLERFVLATGKNYSHRIYIGKKIYADLTLIYQNGEFQALPWTYPDYAGRDLLFFLGKVRDKLRIDLKRNNK